MQEYRVVIDLVRKDKKPILSLSSEEIKQVILPIKKRWVDAYGSAVLEGILVTYDTITFRECIVTATLQQEVSDGTWSDMFRIINDGNGIKKV